MTDEDTMIEVFVAIRRDGVVVSTIKYGDEVEFNVSDLLIVGALEIITQSLRMERMKRLEVK